MGLLSRRKNGDRSPKRNASLSRCKADARHWLIDCARATLSWRKRSEHDAISSLEATWATR